MPDARHAPPRLQLQSIEAARGIAALLVILYHAERHLRLRLFPTGGLFQWGHAGVDFFFVLSGFLILTVHHADLGNPARLSRYVQRRFSRIYPFYWLVLAGTFVLNAISPKPETHSLLEWLSAVLLLPGHPISVHGTAWTLQNEILFYSVFALMIVSRRIGGFCLCIWGFASVAALTITVDKNATALLCDFNVEFFFGMGAALWCLRRSVPRPALVLACGVIAFIGISITEIAGHLSAQAGLARLLYGSASTCILLGLVECERRGTVRIARPFGILGAASYALYLTHIAVFDVVHKLYKISGAVGHVPAAILYVVMVAIAIGCGVLLSRLVEHPVISFSRTRFAARRPEGLAAA